MRPKAVEELVGDQLLPLWESERERLDRVDRWYRWQADDVRVPRAATPELRSLVELSKTPWLGLVVSTIAQAMYVDGYRSPDGEAATATAWEAWQRNDWDARQLAIHRGALAYGYSFATVMPGVDGDGQPAAVMRGVSPRRMQAVYQDPAEDDWPMYTIRCESSGSATILRVLDEEAEYFLSIERGSDRPVFIEHREHGIGVCPVVRYWDHRDLDGRTPGEVEPFVPVAARINKTSFDRMMVQHFSSWKVRTAAGMTKPEDEGEVRQAKLALRQDDMLIAEDPDTKFGTLDETPLSGFISAWESDIEALAAVTQTPTHALTGKLINLSAEALAAARAALTQKVAEYQKGFGKSHDQTLKLAAHIEGDAGAATDWQAHVTWQDMEVRSFSQAADALGKVAQMLGVPVRALWPRIPGVTKTDVDEWSRIADESDTVGALLTEMQAQAETGAAVEVAPDGGDRAGF